VKSLTQISSIFVALLFIYSINFKSLITINYFINQAEITELFCINKEKPQLKCNGKCHLLQEITDLDDNKDENPFSETNLSYNLEINLSFFQNIIDFSPIINPELKTNYTITTEAIADGFFSIPFIPPRT